MKVFVLSKINNTKECKNTRTSIWNTLRAAQKSMAEDIEMDLQNHPWNECECDGTKDFCEYDFFEMKNMFEIDPDFNFDAKNAKLTYRNESVKYHIEEREVLGLGTSEKGDTYEYRLQNLRNEALTALRLKLAKIEGQRITLPEAVLVVIDGNNGFTYQLNVKHALLVNGEVALFKDMTEETMKGILDFEHSDGHFPDDCWFEESDWTPNLKDLFSLIDRICN